jgi:hypothetical protein
MSDWRSKWKMTGRGLAAAALVGACGLAVVPAPAIAAPDADAQLTAQQELQTAPWVRTVLTPGGVLEMQVAVRRMVPKDGTGPALLVAGAVHIGDREYYRVLQESLENLPLVLYEGVLPAGGEARVPANDREARELTEARLRLLATMSLQFDGASNIDEMLEKVADKRKARTLIETARIDGWGNRIRMRVDEDGKADFLSLGADGEPGGEGMDRDLRFSDQRPLAPAERGEVDGMQVQLANALGLHFQLEEMSEDGPNWRHADMSTSEIEARVAALGGDASALFDQLGGTGLPSQLIGMVLRLVETFPGAQARAKMMLMDMLAQSEILEIGMPGPDGQALMQVIIDERNQVIVDRLLEALPEAAANDWDTIGIIYGAGHMPDLLERLDDQVGYRVESGEWNTAISLDLEAAGISMRERAMYKRQIEMQMRAMQRQLERDRVRENRGGR